MYVAREDWISFVAAESLLHNSFNFFSRIKTFFHYCLLLFGLQYYKLISFIQIVSNPEAFQS